MSAIRVKLDIIHERILADLIKRKFFKTKDDAINAGIMLLAKKYRNKLPLKNFPKKDPLWEDIKAGLESGLKGPLTEWKPPFK